MMRPPNTCAAGDGVVITAMGAVSAAGPSLDATLERVFHPRPTLGSLTRYDLDLPFVVGEAPETAFAEHEFPAHDSPTARLCLAAARECLELAGVVPDGLALGTSTGGQAVSEECVEAILEHRPPRSLDLFGQGLVSGPMRLLVREFGIRGPVQTLCTACTSSSHAIVLGARWVASGRARRVLVGGGDALCLTTLGSFRALQLTGDAPATPFGRERSGMSIGEGAAFFLLESRNAVEREGRSWHAMLLGSGMSSDANHMTAPEPGGLGAARAIRAALANAALPPEQVDHVNAHGTGTQLNDAAEAAALAEVFGSRSVPVSSVKGLLGHALGGAGALNALVSIESILRRRAPGNHPSDVAGDDCPVRLVPADGEDLTDSPVVLSNSFAFGGNNVSLIFGGPS
jgi:3-oxoacyl-[acyl-carrier-protein] synthase I